MNKLCDNASLYAYAAIHPRSSEIGGRTAPYGDLSLHKVQLLSRTCGFVILNILKFADKICENGCPRNFRKRSSDLAS